MKKKQKHSAASQYRYLIVKTIYVLQQMAFQACDQLNDGQDMCPLNLVENCLKEMRKKFKKFDADLIRDIKAKKKSRAKKPLKSKL